MHLLTPEEVKLAFSTNAFSGPMNPTFIKMESHLPGSKIPIAQASRAGVAGTGGGSSPTRGGFLLASRQEAPVIPMQKTGYEPPPDVTIEVKVSPQGAEQLVPILKKIKLLGDWGCSRGILTDDEIQKGDHKIGWWDGDGPSRIRSVTIDGKDAFKKEAAMKQRVFNGDHLQYILDKERGDGIDRGKLKEKDSAGMDENYWPYKPGDFKPAKLASGSSLMDAVLRAFDRHMGKEARATNTPAETLEKAQHQGKTPNQFSDRGSSVREVALPKMLTTIGTIARAPVAAVDRGGKY
jgi:hypothetical protein